MHSSTLHNLRTVAIWLAALLSGSAALAYEIAWSRALVVPLGNSTDASALVLAAFMLGIGAGAYFAGRLAERVSLPLRWYAAAEMVLGLCALVEPRLLAQLTAIPGGPAAPVARHFVALALIALPCLAMGASLPLLVRALTRPASSLNAQIGIAYGANTAGAAIGAIATGFFGLATFGVVQWSAWASTASFAAAVVALSASGYRVAPASYDPSKKRTPTTVRLALAATFVSGFAMLANEMLWARVLTFVFGHDTYAFAALLAVVLVGLAIGGMAHRLLARLNPTRLLAGLLGAFSMASLLSFWLAAELVVRAGRDPFDLESTGTFATSVRLELFRELAFTPILVLLPSLLAGAAFPAACAWFAQDAHDVGRRVGTVALFNGLGAAAGAGTVALGLVSVTGIQGGFVALALLCAVTASVVLLSISRDSKASDRTAKALLSLAVLPAAATITTVLLMPIGLPRRMILASVGSQHQDLLHYDEARTGTVSVIRNQLNNERQLLMNAVNEVTTRLVHDQSFKVLGHLAPLLHPQPKRGVMICLGAGLSAGAALTHPLERLDVVDLSAAVAGGARYFAKENNEVLDDPRFHLHINDGRQYLLNTEHRYDIAIIDSTHPKAVDSWILYTHEFYSLVRDRLATGGIAVQWLPLHGLSEWEFKIIVGTFQEAFPKMSLWANVGFETYGQVGYAKLVGVHDGPLEIDYASFSQRLAGTRMGADLAGYGMDGPEELLDLFVAGPEAIAVWTQGLPIQTDDHPIIPYTTRYAGGRRMVPSLLLGVRTPVEGWLRGEVSAQQRAELAAAYEAHGLVLAGNLQRAAELRSNGGKIKRFVAQQKTTLPYYMALAARYPSDVDKQFEAATQLASLGHPQSAKPIYQRVLALEPKDFRTRLDLAHLLINIGESGQAMDLLVQLRKEQPKAAIVHHNLGVAALELGDPGAAKGHLEASLAWDEDSLGARLALARALLALGEIERSESWLKARLDQNPWISDAHDLLGLVASRKGELDTAEKCHDRAHVLDPYRTDYLFNLGGIRARRGNATGAAQAYRSLLRIDPHHPKAWHHLGLALSAQEHFEEAAEDHLHALEIQPDYADAALGLGLALRGQSRDQQAIDAFCLALRLNAGLLEARKNVEALDSRCP